VHNKYVVDSLRKKGAIFVEELSEIPDDNVPVIFSAHEVPRSVPEEASRRNLISLDATCPLVTKVHREAEIHYRRGREILLIGHAGHPEVVGTMGQLPAGSITLVQTTDDIDRYTPRDESKLAYVTQTTLSVDDTAEMVEHLKKRFPNIVGPHKEDICYATTNRQDAVKELVPHVDVLLVIGSKNSSNSNRLVEVARAAGVPAYLIDDETDLDPAWLGGHETVGLTAGASSPELLVDQVFERLAELGFTERAEVEIAREDVVFRLPAELRS